MLIPYLCHTYTLYVPIPYCYLLYGQVTDDEVDEMIRMVDRDGDGQASLLADTRYWCILS